MGFRRSQVAGCHLLVVSSFLIRFVEADDLITLLADDEVRLRLQIVPNRQRGIALPTITLG